MKKLLQSPVVLWGIRILMATAFSVFAFQQVPVEHYSMCNVLFTCAGAFACAIYFIRKTEQENIGYIKKHMFLFAVIFIMVFFVVFESHQTKGVSCYEMLSAFLPFSFFRLRWYLFSMIFLVYFGVWLYRKSEILIRAVFNELDVSDKKMYFLLTVFFSLLVFVVYIVNPKWYLQYDNVYSIDSGWCFWNIFPRVDYYDIRHPVLGEVVFPIWSVIHGVLAFFAPENLMEKLSAVFIQCVNVQFLLMTGVMLKNMVKSRSVFLLYVSSFPFLLFTLSLEKYQLCVFCMVLYVYAMYRNMEMSSGILVIAVGIMPTSGFIGVLELFSKVSIKEKARKIVKIIVLGATVIVCLGRAHLLLPANIIGEVTNMKTSFASGTLTLTERLVSVTKMVHSSFVALSSVASDRYLWTAVTSGITILSMVLILLMVIGAVSHWKERLVRICSLWAVFSVILFVLLNWSPHESPLFAIYFSWAFLPLVKYGVDVLAERLHISTKAAYITMIVAMLFVNIAAMAEIHQYLLSASF